MREKVRKRDRERERRERGRERERDRERERERERERGARIGSCRGSNLQITMEVSLKSPLTVASIPANIL